MVERFDCQLHAEMVPDPRGDFVCYSDYAALKAENERLTRERDALARSNARMQAERALAERAGGMKVDRRALNMAISKWATDSDIDITLGDAEALHEAILSALTTEPAAPEGRQEPIGYIDPADIGRKSSLGELLVHWCCPEMRGRYTQPLYTRPSEQAVTEAMVEAGARAIAQAWGENWECCCAERRGLDCDCGDAMTDERDGYDERLSREDCRMAARAALKAAMEAGRHD